MTDQNPIKKRGADIAPRERPILFSASMVRAILEGSKTQTRRHVKPQPDTQHDGEPYWHVGGYRACGYRPPPTVPLRVGGKPLPCPYGGPGDRLWVRETWARDEEDGQMMYRADLGLDLDAGLWELGRLDGVSRYRWRPSIHMPRWASRIALEIVSVRVERLNDISEADAIAEGAKPLLVPPDGGSTPHVEGFRALWESINGAGSWDLNPWVWVVQFNRAHLAAGGETP